MERAPTRSCPRGKPNTSSRGWRSMPPPQKAPAVSICSTGCEKNCASASCWPPNCSPHLPHLRSPEPRGIPAAPPVPRALPTAARSTDRPVRPFTSLGRRNIARKPNSRTRSPGLRTASSTSNGEICRPSRPPDLSGRTRGANRCNARAQRRQAAVHVGYRQGEETARRIDHCHGRLPSMSIA